MNENWESVPLRKFTGATVVAKVTGYRPFADSWDYETWEFSAVEEAVAFAELMLADRQAFNNEADEASRSRGWYGISLDEIEVTEYRDGAVVGCWLRRN